MSQTYNMQILQGDSFSLRVNASDSNGNYINLSGFGARGSIKYNYSNTGILLNLNPTIDNSYVSGIVNIYLSGSQTELLPVGVFPYDMEITGDSGYVNKFIHGYVAVGPEITTF